MNCYNCLNFINQRMCIAVETSVVSAKTEKDCVTTLEDCLNACRNCLQHKSDCRYELGRALLIKRGILPEYHNSKGDKND